MDGKKILMLHETMQISFNYLNPFFKKGTFKINNPKECGNKIVNLSTVYKSSNWAEIDKPL